MGVLYSYERELNPGSLVPYPLLEIINEFFLLVIFRVYLLDAVVSSGILKGKQKLGVTFNSDKLGGIDFTKFSKLTMCSA